MSLPMSCNSALVAGTLSSPPRRRQLPSGSVLLNLEVRVDHTDRAADSVPVAVFDPTAAVAKLAEGDPVVVVGSIRRRFFRAGGATVSRTEVVADKVVNGNRRATVERLAVAAVAAITAASS